MGVVRREGPWRLEKQDKGVYEITYQQKSQEVILTSEADDRGMGPQFGIGLQVHRVDSYAEAEGLFEERARESAGSMGTGGPVLGGGGHSTGNADSENLDVDLEEADLPPGLIALILVLAGGLAIGTGIPSSMDSPAFLLSAGLIVAGMAVIGWAFLSHETVSGALGALATASATEETGTPSKFDTTPKPPDVSVSLSPAEIKSKLQAMDDFEFEHFVADLWELEGWETEVTQQGRDDGIDVIAKRSGPVEHKLLIQAKRYSEGNRIGSRAIREYNSLTDQQRDADAVAVVTSSGFTKDAKRIGDQLNVKRVDGNDLVSMIDKHEAIGLIPDAIENA